MANISTLGASLDQISRLKVQQSSLDMLTTQLASGKKTQSFSGLGLDVLQSKRARANIGSLETYINNIKNTDRRINLMNNGIKDVKAQAQTILDSLYVSVQQGDFPDFQTIKDLGKNVINFINDVINDKDGERYLFAGADSSTKPLSDTGLFDSFLGEFLPDETDLTNPPLVASGVIGDWGDGTITNEEFIASYRATSDTVIGYSPSLTNNTAGSVYVRVDDNSEYDYTVLANNPGFREILISLNVLNALPPPEFAPGALNDPTATTLPGDTAPFPPEEKQENFFAIVNDLTNLLSNAIDKLDQETFKLSQTQAQITRIKQSHTEQLNALTSIVSEVEDVDLTDVATKINQLQITLEASFRVTALVSELTLARFI